MEGLGLSIAFAEIWEEFQGVIGRSRNAHLSQVGSAGSGDFSRLGVTSQSPGSDGRKLQADVDKPGERTTERCISRCSARSEPRRPKPRQ